MKKLNRIALLAAVSLVLTANVADLRAGVTLKVVIAGPDFLCLFDASCSVTPIETTSTFTVPGMVGEGVLYTRTFAASAGSPAAGSFAYEYELDLSGVEGTSSLNCIRTVTIKLGAPLATLDYNGDGVSGDQVYIAGPIGDKNFVTQAERNGPFVTFDFIGNLVCPGPPAGDTTVRFGVLAGGPPRTVLANLESFDGIIQTGARAPNLFLAALFKLTLLYDTIATLPPGGIVAPTLNAGEGRRGAMLNLVNASLRLIEEDNFLPAVQHLERLLSLTDGGTDDWVQDDPQTRVDEPGNLLQIIQDLLDSLEDPR